MASLAALHTVENRIVGEPLVECGNEYIRFSARTMKPFRGKVFIKGEYSNSDCIRKYSESDVVSAGEKAEFEQKEKDSLEQVAYSGQKKPVIEPVATNTREPFVAINSATAKTGGIGDMPWQKHVQEITPQSTSRSTITGRHFGATEEALLASTENASLTNTDREMEGKDRERATAFVSTSPDTGKATFGISGPSSSNSYHRSLYKGISTTKSSPQSLDQKEEVSSLITSAAPERYGKSDDTVFTKSLSGTTGAIPSASEGNSLETTTDFSAGESNTEQGDPSDETGSMLREPINTKKSKTAEQPNFVEEQEFGSSMFASTTTNPECPPCPTCQDMPNVRKQRGTSETTADLNVKLGTCNAKHEHRIEQRAVVVSFTVIVSFHENLLTKLDRAYRIQCVYMEGNKMIGADLSVSMPPAKELDSKIDPPKCFYTVKGATGQTIMNARIGELVEHHWSCPLGSRGVHAILVKNCYAESDNTHKVAVIDQNGCTMDSYILPNLQYGPDLLSAKTQAPVFKFPDRSSIGFQCDVAVCLRGDQDCSNITPPKCGSGSRRRRELRVNSTQNLILRTPTIKIVDLDDPMHEFEPQHQNLEEGDVSSALQYCLTVAAFACTIASATFLVTTSVAVVGASFFTSTFQHIDRLSLS